MEEQVGRILIKLDSTSVWPLVCIKNILEVALCIHNTRRNDNEERKTRQTHIKKIFKETILYVLRISSALNIHISL